MYRKHNCDILSNKEGKNKTKLEYDHIHKKTMNTRHYFTIERLYVYQNL